jgi:CRP-like cAMP-binding protein
MQSFIDTLTSEVTLKEETILKLKSWIISTHFKKGEIIQNKGEINRKIFFVKKGLLRSYVIDVHGKEHIYTFAPENWAIWDAMSPNELIIDAIEDSEIDICNEAVFQQIFSLKEESSFSVVLKLINRIAALQNRVILLISANAWERYQHFVTTYPSIIQRVPQKMIASYLGITPEALSKIRGNMVKKK